MSKQPWAVFLVGDERFAVPVADVHEVVAPLAVTEVPLAARHLRGLVSLKGTVVPMVDLRLLLGEPTPTRRDHHVVVLKTAEGPLGLSVDEVDGVVELPDEVWLTLPQSLPTVRQARLTAVASHDGQTYLRLGLENLCE